MDFLYCMLLTVLLSAAAVTITTTTAFQNNRNKIPLLVCRSPHWLWQMGNDHHRSEGGNNNIKKPIMMSVMRSSSHRQRSEGSNDNGSSDITTKTNNKKEDDDEQEAPTAATTTASTEDGETTPTSSSSRWRPLSLIEKILLPIQLAFAIYLLLLLPSSLALHNENNNLWLLLMGGNGGSDDGSNGSALSVMGTLPYEYMLFFSLLILPRSYKYGKFAEPVVVKSSSSRSDIQDSSSTAATTAKGAAAAAASILEVIVFITVLVGSHWIAVYQYTATEAATADASGGQQLSFAYPITFFIIRFFATVLVAWSGHELGKSYDRVTRPDELITTGPYSVVRHPIYTSYFILFSSTLLTLRSYVVWAVFVAVATVFYVNRMESEDELLLEAFGEDYEIYKEHVPWSLFPFIY